MDIGSAFTYVFDDKDWVKKLAVGGMIAALSTIMSTVLIGIVLSLALEGYRYQAFKYVREGQAVPLPEWSAFGAFLAKGAKIFVIRLVYNLPALLVACPVIAVYSTSFVDTNLDPELLNRLTTLSRLCWTCLLPLLALLGNALFPAALIHYAQDEKLSSAFRFGEIFSFIRRNIGDYLITVLLAFVAGLVATLGIIFCLVGGIFLPPFGPSWSAVIFMASWRPFRSIIGPPGQILSSGLCSGRTRPDLIFGLLFVSYLCLETRSLNLASGLVS